MIKIILFITCLFIGIAHSSPAQSVLSVDQLISMQVGGQQAIMRLLSAKGWQFQGPDGLSLAPDTMCGFHPVSWVYESQNSQDVVTVQLGKGQQAGLPCVDVVRYHTTSTSTYEKLMLTIYRSTLQREKSGIQLLPDEATQRIDWFTGRKHVIQIMEDNTKGGDAYTFTVWPVGI